MKVILREDESGVAEVVGTILILAMTVVLFSVIIIWVTNIPTPAAQTRLDIQSTMIPGVTGANITLLHQGGEPLTPAPTVFYVTYYQVGFATPQTDIIVLHRFAISVNPNGLLDGSDSVWDLGERWAYRNAVLDVSRPVSITIVDVFKSIIVWSGQLNPPAGSRPPVFIDKWADGNPSTSAIDPVQAGLGFRFYAKVADPDNDLNPNKVYATWYGTGIGACETPYQMRDDGVSPDQVAGDGIFTLGFANPCLSPPYPLLSWAGSIILLNATDLKGHMTTTRFVLNVVPQTSGGGGTFQSIPSQLWQYIGFIQVRVGEVWVTNLGDPYSSANTFQPYRVTATQLNANGGSLFHFRMANHGNTTIFIDGWTASVFTSASRAAVKPIYIVKPVDPARPANTGGIAAYPGTATNPNDFQYAQVFDIDPAGNQEKGGTPTVVLVAAQTAFASDWPNNFRAETLFISLLISGMAGPSNYTFAQLTTGSPNPANCGGLGPAYNPINHLTDPIRACRSQWYAQVIPFIGMVVY